MRASLPAVTGSTPLERRMRSILDATAERGAISRRYATAIAFACLAIAMPLAALQQDDKIHSTKQDKSIVRPKVLHKVEPTYTEAAREAKVMGTVVMSVIVEKDGTASNMKILKGLDPGLDENAMAAVKQWKFAPGTKDGKPVRVSATIEVNFRLN
ncbi:MAG: energy transducer TonB [Acidobacteria bacterium]|nr:energy transducer TonB [Acidobacteriota bacterium]